MLPFKYLAVGYESPYEADEARQAFADFMQRNPSLIPALKDPARCEMTLKWISNRAGLYFYKWFYKYSGECILLVGSRKYFVHEKELGTVRRYWDILEKMADPDGSFSAAYLKQLEERRGYGILEGRKDIYEDAAFEKELTKMRRRFDKARGRR